MTKVGKNFTGVYFRVGSDKNKTFYIAYRVGGKLVWERVGTEWEGATAQKAYKLRNDRIVLGSSRAVRLTLNAAFEKVVLDIRADGGSSSYVSMVEFRYNRFIKPVLGHKDLSEISVEDLNRLKLSLMDKGYATTYVKSIIKTVKEVYSRMILAQLYQGFNPTAAIRFKKISAGKTRALKPEETHRLLAELEGVNKDVYRRSMLALYSGLRKSEIARLTVNDVCLERSCITVHNVKSPNEEGRVRTVFFPGQVKAMLGQLISEGQLGTGDKLFPRKFRDDIFIRAVRKLGLNEGHERRDHITFHGLRHTHATMIGALSKDPFMVKDQLGHSDIAMSMKYTHVDNRSAEFVQRIGETLTI
jgi:integrase